MKYTQKRWLERLEAAELPDPVKVTGRLFAAAVGNRARWRPYYEAAYEQDRSVDVLGHLHRIARHNLLAYHQGCFAPILGPPVPRTGQYRLPAAQLELIDTMLRQFGGRSLYYIAKHGYIDQRNAKARWLLRAPSPVNGKWPATRAIPSRIVRPLVKRGLIKANGCNWGGPSTAELEVNCFRLYAIAGLPKRLRRYVREERPAE